MFIRIDRETDRLVPPVRRHAGQCARRLRWLRADSDEAGSARWCDRARPRPRYALSFSSHLAGGCLPARPAAAAPRRRSHGSNCLGAVTSLAPSSPPRLLCPRRRWPRRLRQAAMAWAMRAAATSPASMAVAATPAQSTVARRKILRSRRCRWSRGCGWREFGWTTLAPPITGLMASVVFCKCSTVPFLLTEIGD